ncbi:MAG TPA: FIVAR domain-containing protein, partial [Candidatus Fimimorpha faecalis]|nr:FIVAR domain-containing protein [Candidatus Fimimorpha faecalis]
MRKNKRKRIRTMAWICCASLVSGSLTPTGVIASDLNYKMQLEKEARESTEKEVGVTEEKNSHVETDERSIPTEANLVYETERLTMNSGKESVDATEYLDVLKGLETGTITVRYRAKDASQGLSALFSLSSTQAGRANSYAVVYVNPSSGTVGVEVRDTVDGKTTNYNQSSKVTSINDDYWHTLTYVFGNNSFTIYVDGEAALQNNKTGFFNKVSDPTTVKVGALDRVAGANQWGFSGYIDKVQVWDGVLSEEQILPEHQATKQKETEMPEGVMKTEDTALFYQNYDNSISYRIPSLLTTLDGTVIAGIDKRQSGAGDTGNIDAVIRRSLDGGDTWGDPQTLIDLPKGGDRYSFTIDASMVQDRETGRIFFIVDMFPESTALMSGDTIDETSSAYKEIDGERYYILKDAYEKEYTIRENGIVYDENGNQTDYTVPKLTNGILYKAGEECGNIFLRTGENAGELRALKTSYLWMVYSDDDGATWSEPVDITKGIKKDWQLFFGTGPGVGIQMENGRLVVPVYYTNSVIGNSQSSAVIYSDDHGETWKCGESPNDGRLYNGQVLNSETLHNTSAMLTESQVVEVKDKNGKGVLKLFCRSYQGNVMIATSYDGGETWEDELQQDKTLRDPYCQMTVVPYPYEVEGLEGKQLFVFANPNASSRSNGTVRLGYYDPNTDEFVWPYSQVVFPGNYAYSCLSVLGENQIGLFYEAVVPNMMFTKFNTEWIMFGSEQEVQQSGPQVKGLVRDGNTVILEASEEIFLMGNMTLKVKIDGIEQSLTYQSGSGTTKLVFALPEGTSEEAEIVYDSMDTVELLEKYYGNAQNETFVAAGSEQLNQIVEKAQALNESDYSEGWELLQEKLQAANAVQNKLNPTNEEIQTAILELQEAMDALVVSSVNKSALQEVIDTYKDAKKEDYSEKSWNWFESVMTEAKEILQADNYTQSQINEVTEQLTAAGQALSVDKSSLWAAIEKYGRYEQQKYEAEGWETFVQALETATVVANTEQVVQSQITEVFDALINAAAALTALPKVDKTELRALMHEASSYKEVNYEETTWNAFIEVLQTAKNISADDTAIQKTVDDTKEALETAISALKVITGNVGGSVTDASGNAIEGVTVCIGDIRTKTAADGTYLLYGVPIGDSKITAEDDQYITVTENVTVTEENAGIYKAVHNFVLNEASTTIKGVVSAVGVPMPGLTVTLSATNIEKTTVTNEQGEYVFENVPTKDYLIQTAADGYEALSKEFSATKQEENTVNLMLLPRTPEGAADYVNDYEDGKIYWANLPGTTNIAFANENGATKLTFPSGGWSNAYETQAPEFKNGCIEMDITPVTADGTRVGILFRAKDMDNRIYVGVEDRTTRYFTQYWNEGSTKYSGMSEGESFDIGKTMHWKAEIVDNTITLWINGTQVLSNTMEGMPTEAGYVGLNCRTGKEVLVDNIKVTSYDAPTGEQQNVAGRVANNGAALKGAEVTLLQGETVIGKTTTDELGNYKFKNVPYGTYHVQVISGENSKSAEIVVQETDGYCVVPVIEFGQETVDKSALELMIKVYETYSKEDYTEESFTAFFNVLEEARAVLTNENAVQAEVDKAMEALEKAASELVKKPITVDKSALETATAIYEAYKQEDYTEESFAALAEAVKQANEVLANAAATQEQVDTALENLNKAAEGLVHVPVVDKAKLKAVLSIYNEYEASDYTEESFASFAEALEMANAIMLSETATQEEADKAVEVLIAAANALDKAEKPVTVNRSILKAIVSVYGQYKAEDYTAESFARLQQALIDAKKVIDRETATQEEVDAAEMALIDAAKKLENPPAPVNKTGLQVAVSIYGTYDSAEYTEESFAALQEMIQKAKQVLENEAVTQKEVDETLSALSKAVAALEKKPVEKTLAVSYRTHVQNDGWQDFVSNGETSGTHGRGLRLEGIEIRLDYNNLGGGIEYRTHV